MGELFYDKAEPIEDVIIWVYEEGAFSPIGMLKENKHFSIVSDYIGRPVQAYDSAGELVWSTDYDIYGRLKNQKGEKQLVPFRQLGQYEDEELGGLYFNRFRYYDSEAGLYISKDPIRLAGGIALYSYVHDTNAWIDLLGLTPINPFDIVPYKPSSSPLENHHGILDVWAANNINGYQSRASHNPTIALTKEQHAATKAVYRDWLEERTGKRVGGKVDWTSVSFGEVHQLAERMFDAAQVPQHARDAYYQRFNQYVASGCKG